MFYMGFFTIIYEYGILDYDIKWATPSCQQGIISVSGVAHIIGIYTKR